MDMNELDNVIGLILKVNPDLSTEDLTVQKILLKYWQINHADFDGRDFDELLLDFYAWMSALDKTLAVLRVLYNT